MKHGSGSQLALDFVQFDRLRELVNRKAGLHFDDASLSTFEKRLAERPQALGLPDFDSYIEFVSRDAKELDLVLTLLTTKETYFFRQEYQLKAFRDEVVPQLVKAGAHHKRLTIWSAGCSTGEEAYTLAMLLLELPSLAGWFLRVLGTDLCRQNVEFAQRGIYRGGAFRAIEPRYMEAHFVALADGTYRVSDGVRRVCHFSQVNLLDTSEVRTVGRVDVVFCRNVIIYFDEASRRSVLTHLHQRLLPGGYLFLGHSESLLNVSSPFVSQQLTGDLTYRRMTSIPPPGRSA